MENDIKRVARLTSILTILLTRKVVSATKLAEQFSVSTRTIYRDIRTLESAGVPIYTEEGKGFSLMEGYKIPPIMLSENEANALLTAELVVMASKDTSLIENFTKVTSKIKSLLPSDTKAKLEKLNEKVAVTNFYITNLPKSKFLMKIQEAIIENQVLEINYKDKKSNETKRKIEAFAVYANQKEEWVLIAFCRLRKDFREFSIINILDLTTTNEKFIAQTKTFKQYLLTKYGKEMLEKFE